MILGYNHPVVEEAAEKQRKKGNCFNLPSPLSVDLAEYLVDLIPSADWAIFGKNGSDVVTFACEVARAYTGKKKIVMARGAYHGIDPWCNPSSFGITEEDRANVIVFPYNDVKALKRILETKGDSVAGIVLSPLKHEMFHDLEMPAEEFLIELRKFCDKDDLPLIIDDIRVGFRLHMGGSAEFFGLRPHLTCFSKAMANGYPISACAGAMGFMDAARKVFFTGSFFNSAVPMASALATLNEMVRSHALVHIFNAGERLKAGMLNQARSLGLDIHYTGPVSMPFMTFEEDPSFEKIKVFCAHAYQEGVFFHPYHNWFISAAHGDEEIEMTLEVTEKAFRTVKEKFGP
jgi:glutamate-1-semialdehyde 2,1-aminomutase